MMAALITFHGAVAVLCLTYFIRFSKESESYNESIYNFFRDAKDSFTRELVEEISTLLKTDIPSKIVLSDTNYSESALTSPKGEKFREFLNNYLQKETGYIVRLYEIRKAYSLCRKWSMYTENFSMGLVVVELLALVLHFFLSYCTEKINTSILLYVNSFSLFLIIVGLVMLARKSFVTRKAMCIKDDCHGL